MQVCLTADETNFLNPKAGFFITGFIPSIPRIQIPTLLRYPMEKLLFANIETSNGNGEVIRAPLGLRRLEATLVNGGIDCKVISPQRLDKLVEEVEVFGVSTMDPLGLGPVSATFRGLLNNVKTKFDQNKPYTYMKFEQVIRTLRKYEKPIIVGGSGACQFELRPEKQDELGIDTVVIGDADLVAVDIFKKVLEGKKLPKIMKIELLQDIERDVTPIQKPTNYGIIEISRGCDRRCKFCDPTIRKFHWFSPDRIKMEAKRVAWANENYVRLLSEDCLRYGNKIGDWVPRGGLVKLIQEIKKLKEIDRVGLSHACLASALANPEQIEALRDEIGLGPDTFTSLQVGIETGSVRKIIDLMPLKAAPFEPDDWHEVVLEGWKLLCDNYIYPAGTVIVGMEDTEEDLKETVRLMRKVARMRGMFFPLFFMSLGQLKGKKKSYRNDWFVMPNKMREIYLISLEQMMRQVKHIDGLVFGNDSTHKIMNQILIMYFQGVHRVIKENVMYDKVPTLLSFSKIEFVEALKFLREKIRAAI
ncbi:MAG: B12-binding domain-containing radical SAM protein [Candidatus Helarchaeota archaeon]